MREYHKSVLLHEVITFLSIKPGEKYIDATIGGGGHTLEMAKRGGRVLGLDVDEEALAYVALRIQNPELRITGEIKLVKGNFEHLEAIATKFGFVNVSGILFDLGVSGHQFDTDERGFSFQRNGQLDMRMDQTLSVSAKDLVNGLTKGELIQLFLKYGEEYRAKRIAQAIVKERENGRIETTEQLAEIIKHAVGFQKGKLHPATKVFQALRIAVNDELYALEKALPQAFNLLKKEGRIAVISFHSLEDRIVKNYFLSLKQIGKAKIITKKPIIPSYEEIDINNSARSAKLRVIEKIYA